MKLCFDLDGTLCTNTYGEYQKAEPFYSRIQLVNKLYEQDNYIIVESARGSTTKIDWQEFTLKQLNSWGLKFHLLRTGVKIDADIYIDDKAINDKQYFLD
jgi:hypothetical protein